MKSGAELSSGSHTPTYVATPTLTEHESVLLIACVSARRTGDNRLLPKEKLSRTRIYPSVGSCSKQYITCETIDSISIGLSMDELSMGPYSVCVSLGEELVNVSIQLPLNSSGCRYSYYIIDSLQLNLCIVHDVVSVESDIDLFIEEQDFLFSCMEIQDELFLKDYIPQPIDSPVHEDLSPSSPVNCDLDHIKLNNELRVMNSLIAKYEQNRTSNNSMLSSIT